MNNRARVIICNGNKILLVHRIKNGKNYYVIPGGGIDEGENIIQGAIREVKEETNLEIQIGKKLREEEFEGQIHHYFLSTKYNGELKLGGPEIKRQSDNNVYLLERIEIKNIYNINLIPEDAKQKISNIQI